MKSPIACGFWTDTAFSSETLPRNSSEVILQCWTWHCFRGWPHTDPMGDMFHSKRPAWYSTVGLWGISLKYHCRQQRERPLSWLRLLRYLSAAEAELCGNWCLWELKGIHSFAKDQKSWSYFVISKGTQPKPSLVPGTGRCVGEAQMGPYN